MERINRYKNHLANGVSFIVLTAAYQLRLGEAFLFDSPNANIIAAAALFGLSNFITRNIANLAMHCRAIKNWVLGPLNVSGYWLVNTSAVNAKDKSILIEPAILDMRFDSQTGEFKVDAYRYIKGEEFITKSKFASVKYDGHTRYLNYFKVESSDQFYKYGHACGKFTNEAGQVAKTLTATNSIEGEDIQRFQHGTRIELWKVKRFKAKFGSRNWIEKFLETKGLIYDGEAVDLKESGLIDIINSLTATAKAKKLAEIELDNYRNNILPQRGVKRFFKKLAWNKN